MKSFLCSPTEPIVRTKQGLLRGYKWDDMYYFKGVTYAEAERFQQPHPPTPWEGIREAQLYGFCSTVVSPYQVDRNMIVPHRYWHASEHCQNLNIWSTTLDENARKPVMVWLHGGGYANGSSIEHVDYDGENLARYGDVVMVSINHRLNIIGYLDMSSFGDERYANSVNAGNADIVAALQWIHENIALFGGDPDNVTIFGQSGGGGKVSNLLQIPAAAGLFHKAIIESGVGDIGNRKSIDGRKAALAMLEHLGLAEKDYEQLANIPIEKLIETFKAVSKQIDSEDISFLWGPKANDWFPGDMREIGISEHAKHIPVIIGSVFAEFTSEFEPMPEKLTEQEQFAIVKKEFGDHASEVLEAFRQAYPEKPDCYAAYADRIFRSPSLKYAASWIKQSEAPIFSYMLSYTFPYMGSYPTWHCAEIPFAFHNNDLIEVYGNEDCYRLQEQINGAWVAFAHTGNPNHSNMINWPAFNKETEATIVFDKETTVRNSYDKHLIELLDKWKKPHLPGKTEDDNSAHPY